MKPAQNSATDRPPAAPAASGLIRFGCFSSKVCRSPVAALIESLVMGHSFRGWLMRLESAIYHIGMIRPLSPWKFPRPSGRGFFCETAHG